jgi:hypothetical protein
MTVIAGRYSYCFLLILLYMIEQVLENVCRESSLSSARSLGLSDCKLIISRCPIHLNMTIPIVFHVNIEGEDSTYDANIS